MAPILAWLGVFCLLSLIRALKQPGDSRGSRHLQPRRPAQEGRDSSAIHWGRDRAELRLPMDARPQDQDHQKAENEAWDPGRIPHGSMVYLLTSVVKPRRRTT